MNVIIQYFSDEGESGALIPASVANQEDLEKHIKESFLYNQEWANQVNLFIDEDDSGLYVPEYKRDVPIKRVIKDYKLDIEFPEGYRDDD
jgi:hypothetical protein